ncbi:MAG: hypothetical protein Q9160_006671 [Pyrenula sp. 1 TL-2023]
MSPPNSPPKTHDPSDSSQLESFAPMTEVLGAPGADLDALGAHCQLSYCHVLDFLPFKCLSCEGTFCLDHRSETAHKCSHAGEWAKRRRQNSLDKSGRNLNTVNLTAKPTVATGTQCSDPSCKTLIHTLQNTGVHCPNCNRNYCLKHRLREDHSCSKLIPIGARPAGVNLAQAQAEKARLAFSRLRSWGKDKTTELKPKPKPMSKAAQVVALNNLRKTAKGDPGLAVEKRVYLHVEAEAATTTSKLPKADLYFNRDWTIGRLLDEAAKRMQVDNKNNHVKNEEERLRVFYVEGGRVLGFGEKVNNAIVDGGTIVLLRGIGEGQQDLIET